MDAFVDDCVIVSAEVALEGNVRIYNNGPALDRNQNFTAFFLIIHGRFSIFEIDLTEHGAVLSDTPLHDGQFHFLRQLDRIYPHRL